jgi:CPA2 family monovalent cation:H+ antiporter-2
LTETEGMAAILLELGAIVLALAVLARIAARTGFSPIPLYLLAGLGLSALRAAELSPEAVQLESNVAVALLLFMLGLEYTGEELASSLRSGRLGGAVDFALNFTPGFGAGLLFGWPVLEAIVLGGITYISSSGIIAKVLDDLECSTTSIGSATGRRRASCPSSSRRIWRWPSSCRW